MSCTSILTEDSKTRLGGFFYAIPFSKNTTVNKKLNFSLDWMFSEK